MPQPESKPAESVTAPKQESNSQPVEGHSHPPAPSAEPPVSNPPSRTGSPFAPPLPRRAAARRAVPQPPAGPRARSSPTPPPAAIKALEQLNGHHVEPETRAEPEAKANAPDPVAAAESDPLPPSEQPGSPPKEKEKEKGEEEAVAGLSAAEATEGSAALAPLGAEAETETEIVHVTGEATAELNGGGQSEETPPQQPMLSGDGSTLRGDAAVEKVSAEGASDAAAVQAPHHAPLPPPRRLPLPVRPTERQALPDMASLNDDKGADHHSRSRGTLGGEKPEEQGFAPDGTPYVGDGTWEERTWKELTRLREDMFWARMGGAQ